MTYNGLLGCNCLNKPKFLVFSQFRRGEWRPTGERSSGSGKCRRRRRKEQEPAGRQRRSRLAVGSGARPAEHAAASRVVPVPRHRAGHVAQVHVEELVAGLRRVSHCNLNYFDRSDSSHSRATISNLDKRECPFIFPRFHRTVLRRNL